MVAYQYLYLHRSTPLQFQLEFRQFQFPFYVISCISSVVLWSRGLIALFVQVPVELYTYVRDDGDDDGDDDDDDVCISI